MLRFLPLLQYYFQVLCYLHRPATTIPQKLDSVLQDTTVRPFSGVVMITQQGKTKYLKAYGYADFAHKNAFLKSNIKGSILIPGARK